MKLIFLGTPAFALPSLERLARTSHEIAVVITRPDRPKGRGMELAPPAAKTAAQRLGLRIIQPEHIASPEVLEEVRRLSPEIAVVVAYGQLLKHDFLNLPPLGCVNLHPSLLPRYRGPTPIQSAIIAGEQTTGVTTMLLDEGMDTGDILLQREVMIAPDDTAGTLHDRLASVGGDLIVETVEGMEHRRIEPCPQDESEATLTRKLTKKDGLIDWTRSPREISNLVRAMDPWPGCHTVLDGKPLKIWRTTPGEDTMPDAAPGEVTTSSRGGLIVKAGDGTVHIERVQASGGKRMSSEDFLLGHPVESGTVLGR